MTWEQAVRALPIVIFVAGVAWALWELRLGKLLEKRDEVLKEALRREFQGPIGNIGKEAMDNTEDLKGLRKDVLELQTKMRVFWRMIERSTANLLRRPDDEE